jgi:hypothetical protein
VRSTDEYRIAYWPQDEEQASSAAEAARVAIARLRYAFGVKLEQPVEIELCHTHTEFAERVGGNVALSVQGLAFPAELRVILRPLGPLRTATVVAHELVHVFLQRKLDETGAPAPLWLHEGLAKYVTGDLPVADQQILGEAVRSGELTRIADLEPLFSGSPQQIALGYAASYSLVEYLASLEGKTGVSGFLEELGRVGDVDRALVRAYQMRVEELEQQWLAGVGRSYMSVRSPDVFGEWLWTGVAVLFLLALVVQLRRSAAIRRRMQEEENLRSLFETEPDDDTAK